MPVERTGYAICTVMRSGSTWLAELLAGTGVLGFPAEYFSTEFQQQIRDAAYPTDRRAQAELILRDGATPNGIYGFKIFPVNLESVSRYFNWIEVFPNLRFIHLRRRDVLGQALSRVRAVQTRRWRSTHQEQHAARYDGAAILEALRFTASQDARWEVFFARNGIEPLRLVYEDALQAAGATIAAVADLVGFAWRPTGEAGEVGVEVQRDALTQEWRSRFLSEFADRNTLDQL